LLMMTGKTCLGINATYRRVPHAAPIFAHSAPCWHSQPLIAGGDTRTVSTITYRTIPCSFSVPQQACCIIRITSFRFIENDGTCAGTPWPEVLPGDGL
jgi:hypothetical protein